jgi:hypothetical protein
MNRCACHLSPYALSGSLRSRPPRGRRLRAPTRGDPPLVINPDAVLTLRFPRERLELVASELGEILQAHRRHQNPQLPLSLSAEALEARNPLAPGQPLGPSVPLAPDQVSPYPMIRGTSSVRPEASRLTAQASVLALIRSGPKAL